MKCLAGYFTIGMSALAFLGATHLTNSGQHTGRETVLDGIEHVDGELADEVPRVPSLCDEMRFVGKRINIGQCALYCEVEGSGTPIVLLHGGPGATHHYFHPYFSHANAWAQVVYYDQRGCGQSDYSPSSGYSLGQAVNDLDALRSALGIEKWFVLGHSYGGTLAQCYAVAHPDRLLGLVLVSSAYYGHSITPAGSREYDLLTTREIQRIQEIRNNSSLSPEVSLFNSHRVGDWKRQSFYRPTDEQLARLALYEWKHDAGFRAQISQSLDSTILENRFERCPFPILIAEGKWDLTWGTDKASKFHTCFPNSTLVVFDRAGHNPFGDVPQEFFGVLKRFVTESKPPTDAEIANWKAQIAGLTELDATSPSRMLRMLGWGHASSLRLAEAYSTAWLVRVKEPRLLLRLGFALYDAERYEDALRAFEGVARDLPPDDYYRSYRAVSAIWQGHMLDLLDRREQALEMYRRVVDMNIDDMQRHDQYGLAYAPSRYAAERLETPFSRVENKDPD